MRTDGPSTRYNLRPELTEDRQQISMVLDRHILVVHGEGEEPVWLLAGSTVVDRLDGDAAMELMLQLGGAVTAVMRARREAQDRGECAPVPQIRPEAVDEYMRSRPQSPVKDAAKRLGHQAAPEAAPGVNPGMHVYGPEDGPTVTLTLPLAVVDDLWQAVHEHVPANTGVDGAFLDEVRHQLADQRRQAELAWERRVS
jgi:hypothetical protein